MTKWLTIGDFAALTGLTPRALRIYEEIGLIESIARGENGYRYFQHSQIEAVGRIRKLKEMGFSLREIRALFLIEPNSDRFEIRALFLKRLTVIGERESELRSQKESVLKVLNQLQQENSHLSSEERNNLMSQIQTELPLISLRDVVLFPSQRKALYIGRDFSKRSVEIALDKYKGEIAVVTQKFVEMNDKPDPDQIFEVGCICQILESTQAQDGSIKIIVEAKTRWQVVNLIDREGARFCKGLEIPHSFSPLKQEIKSSLIEQVKRVAPFGVESLQTAIGSTELIARAISALDSEKAQQSALKGRFLTDLLSPDEAKNINVDLARIQEILSAKDHSIMAEKILELWPSVS